MSPDLANPVLVRALIALVIITAGMAAYAVFNRRLLARARRSGVPGMPEIAAGSKPTVVYFTTPECAPCRTVQRPALRRLQEQMPGRLEVIEIDAAERPDLAGDWGVFSVPTTFILDERGALRHVNHGVARAETLRRQIDSL